MTSLRMRREDRSGLALGALLTLAGANTVALLTDSGVLAGVAADALLHATVFAAPDVAAYPIRTILLRRWRRRILVRRSSVTLTGSLRAHGGDRLGRLDVGPLLRRHGRRRT